MEEILSEEIRLAIQSLIIKCANDAKEQADNFVKNETSVGKQHPMGLNAHIIEVIFEQKKEIKKASILGSRWMNSNCPEVFSKDVIGHIIELATDHYVKEKEDDIRNFNSGLYKELWDDSKHLKNLKEYYLDAFFKGIRRIYALEDIIKPQEIIGPTLWSLFKRKDIVEKVKRKLIAAGYMILNDDDTFTFIPSGKQIRSEPASLYQALEFLEYIEKMEYSYTKMVGLLKNTFKGFDCDEQAIAKGFKHKNVKLFRSLCTIE